MFSEKEKKVINKKELIAQIKQDTGVSAKEAVELFDCIIDELSQTLIAGQDVKCVNFGTFHVREMSERVGRNPQTGKEMLIQPSAHASFSSSQTFTAKLNKKNFF